MPRVIILSRHASAAPIEIDAPEGGALVDLCDARLAPIPFSCRSANCGACRVEILEGADALCAPEAEERAILALFASPPTHRLACSAKVKPGLVTLRLRAIAGIADAEDEAKRASSTVTTNHDD